VSEHTMALCGDKLVYIATAGTLDLFGQSGERIAAVYYTAYVRKGSEGDRRPLTFVFNGGPGAASAFLHLGLVGPQVASFGPGGRDGASAQLGDNPDSWLAFTDLVLIDPVGTGWSRAAKSDDAKNFYGVQSDTQAMAKVIALYVAKNSRAASPKFILGESYGGFRAIKVSRALQDDQGIVVSGVIAVSPLIEGALQFGANRYPLGAALQLPSLAAAELGRRHAFSPEALAAAEQFAMTDYLTTLAGRPPEGAAAAAFYGRVAQISGLPVELVTRQRGFIRDAYVKNLRAGDGAVVSPYDAGFASPDPYPESDTARGDDAVLDGFTRALGGLFVSYARDQLGYKTEMTYELLATDINRKWDWHGAGESMRNASVTGDIRELLALNPGFRLIIAHGVSDLVTPYAANRYVVNHLPRIGPGERVQLKLYRGGHMFYFAADQRRTFTGDVRDFFIAASE
ncbi:MAG: S10 family peptidase, partial [Pseudolabrys sp.]